jgi:hypothetical protein
LPKAVPSSFHEPKPSPSKASSTFTAADVVEEKMPAKNSARIMRFITNNLCTEQSSARAECWYGKDFEGNHAFKRTASRGMASIAYLALIHPLPCHHKGSMIME